jgi:serine/threonine protein kinase/tetratricopeptide (TPR) repeat protein
MANACPACHSDNPETVKFCGECGTPLPPSAGPFPGATETLRTPLVRELARGHTFAGRFEVIEELGHGGMGHVYKVYDTKTKEKIALKLLKPEVSSDEAAIERFGNELRFARRISHRNVCRMYDLGDEKGTHYITMEYVPGEDLKNMLRMMGQMSPGKTIYIARQVCEGLAEAHRLGVVHRDLKPQNIMIDRDGNVRIMDFGIARSLKVKGLTGAGFVVGTPEYMSPEQMEGKEADRRSDIYSLGVILYEMVTGKLPFEGETFVSIALKQKTEAPKSPKEFNAQLPDDLGRLIMKCLARDAGARYQSVEEILNDLGKIEKGMPTTDKALPVRMPMTSREITVKFKLNRLVLPGLALIALIIAAVFLPRLFSHKKGPLVAPGKPSLAVVSFENKTGDKSLDDWSTGLQELLITDLSQSKYLHVLSSDKILSILRKLNLTEAERYSTDDLVKVANEGTAEYTISGSFLKAGSQLLINATLQKPRGEEVIKNLRIECPSLDDITAKVDDLTRQLKAALNLSEQQIATDLDKNLGKITSPNPEALRYYIEAKRYHWKQEYRKAIPLFEKAIALDPEFIVAYEALGSAHYSLVEYVLNDSYVAKSLDLIKRFPDRVSDRDRYLIEGRHYYWDLSDQFYPKAEEYLLKALEIDPEDSATNYDLANLYVDLEQWDKALTYVAVCIKNKYEYLSLYSLAARAYRAKGMPDKARETIESYLKNISDSAAGHLVLANHYLTQGKLDLARQETDKAVILDPTNWENIDYAGKIALLDGDLGQAEKEFNRLLEEKEAQAVYSGFTGLKNLYLTEGKFSRIGPLYLPGIERVRQAGEKDIECIARGYLIYAYLSAGNPGKALDECGKSWAVAAGLDSLFYQRSILCFKGLAYLELKNIPEAEKAAEELKAVNVRGMLKDVDIRIFDHLTGCIELEKKNYNRAIERLRKAVDSLPHGPLETNASYLDSLALAYFRAGDLDKSKTEYERITALTTGRSAYGDIFAKSFYMLGQIFEQKGDKVKARENYRRFLDLWKDADPGRPEVADARERLKILH